MQGLLARLSAQQKNPNLGSKAASRSTSIASSVDDLNEELNDDQQSDESTNTLKPKVKREKDKDKDKKLGWNTGGAKTEVKAKISSRIDTNMVKLKLLDATRKAIIDKTKKVLVSTAMQTDTVKTKLCKDQLIGNQSDLINPQDQATETDLELIALKTKEGVVIVTASVAMNTDKLPTQTVSTQTVMPRSNVSFKRFTDSRHKIHYADEEEYLDDSEYDDDSSFQIEKIERRLKAKKKLLRQRSTQKATNIDIVIEDESDVIAIETIPAEMPNQGKNSDSDYEDSIQDDLDHSTDTVIRRNNVKRQKQAESTFNSWNDLDFEDEKVELPKSCFVEGGPTPWSNFQDLVLGQRFLNARLSPTPQRVQRPNLKQVTWNDTQIKIVNDLMQEANALMDMFDQVAMLLGPDIKLHKVSDVEEFKLPEPKYNEEMTKSCEKLEASLKRLQNIDEPKRIEK